MIRRDYILRMIEEFFEVLSRIRALKKDQRWREANETLEAQCLRLVSANAQTVAAWSETELLAHLIQSEPTHAVQEKTLLLSVLFMEAGDLAAAQEPPEPSRAAYLKGLNLLLSALAQGDPAEFPAFVPRVEAFVTALTGAPLPFSTQLGLMQHYERTGDYAKAEDALYALLEAEPGNPRLVEFGLAFYRRLQAQSDTALAAGNLPRSEIEAGLADLGAKRPRP